MRYIYLVLLMIFFVSPILGQRTAFEVNLRTGHLIQQQEHIPIASAKSAKMLNSYRLIAFNVKENVSGLLENSDSASIKYSGSRGGDLFTEIFYDEAITFTWDGFIYENDRRLTRKYTAAGNLEEDKSEEWDGALWNNDYRTVFTYDASDNLISSTNQDWVTNAWENSFRRVYTYSNGLEESETSQNWNGSSWDNNYRYIYTYTSNDMVDIELFQDYVGGSWQDMSRSIYTYNSNDLITIRLTQNLIAGNWIDQYRTNTTYTAANEVMSTTEQSWTGTAWENNYRTLNDYDSNDNLVGSTSQNFNAGAWENSSKVEYIYDNNGTVKNYKFYLWDGTIWELEFDYTLYYESFVGIPTLSASSNSVYPNPFNNTIHFKLSENVQFDEVNIFDISGMLIYSNNSDIKNGLEIDGSKFPAGVYFYQIKGKDGMETGKIIKQ